MIKKTVLPSLIALILSSVALFSAGAQRSDNETTLTPDATVNEIVEAMEAAHTQYDTIHVVYMFSQLDTNSTVRREAWISQSLGAFRQQTVATSLDYNDTQESLLISDGQYMYDSIGVGGHSLVFVAGEGPENIVRALGGVSSYIAPERLAVRLEMPEQETEIVGLETLNGRNTIKITSYASSWDINIWVDLETGIVVREETVVDGEVRRITMLDFVEFDPTFENAAELFHVDHSAYSTDLINDLLEQAHTEQSQEQ